MSDNLRRPHFRRPPVVEVACGVQFGPLDEWRTSHYGQFWSSIEEEYSQTEDQPPLARLHLDPSPVFEPRFSPLPPLRRVFYVKPPGNFLIQVQQNRFLHNWRQITDSDEYPRFDSAFEKFVGSWQRFNEFLSAKKLPKPVPEIWELTYINHITDSGAIFPRDVWEYLAFYEKSPEATTAMQASAMAIKFAWPLPQDRGSLMLDVQHGHRVSDQRQLLVLDLTARGPAGSSDATMDTWFETAHQAIVNTFEKLTTRRAHDLWKKL